MNVDQYLVQIGELSWSKVFIAGLGALALYYFTLFDDGSNHRRMYQEATVRLAESEKGLQDTKNAMADADRFEKEVKSTQQQFERIVEFMPVSMSAVTLTEIVTKQASAAGAKVTQMEPKMGDDRLEFYEMTRLNLSLEGSYAQIVMFLSNLSRVSRLLTFDKIELNLAGGEPESPQLKFVGVLVGYRFLKKPLVSEKAEAEKENETHADK